MGIFVLIGAILFLSFLKYAEKHERISGNEWINSLNTPKNRKIAKIITYIIIMINVIPLIIMLLFAFAYASLRISLA